MTSGIDWNQSGSRKRNEVDSEVEMEKNNNPIEYILSKKLTSKPGEMFNYCSGNTVLLGKIVEIASGIHLDRFMQRHLFGPLDIKEYKWWNIAKEVYWTHAGLQMKPVDMLKIGQVLLNNGIFKGERILSKEWLEKLKTPSKINKEYALHWWLANHNIGNRKINSYFAAGNGGQRIFVIPRLNLTVVFTAGNYHSPLQTQPNEILEKEILPKSI